SCSPGARLTGELPCPARKRPYQRRHGERLLARRRSVAHTTDDPLQDRSETEEVVGEIERQMWPRIEAGPRNIGVHVRAARRNAEASEIVTEERAHARTRFRRRHVPLHQMVGKIGERVAQGGKLPVEDSENGGPRAREEGGFAAVIPRRA